ncbi:hypothetical protein [Tessaracoccus palaemonis]|uniref:Tfp pilus assembly protein PilN n=1 Tax=Tessaracoccus palaemonis TaxID=2829499 RepID=A0ABX8SNC1_9ACTN|nr:hypothetical protein [Tessaracoccus palaemonis]QXT62684.1 hypothetical protein KDB89_13260 [Tessaracoccus palaemonis]
MSAGLATGPEAGQEDLPVGAVVSTPVMGVVRVDLVPPIVEARRRSARTIRALVYGLVALIVAVVMAILAMSMLALKAETTLDDERTRGQLLVQQQNEYSELISVKRSLADYEFALPEALFAEANWARLMTELDTVLPDEVTLVTEDVAVRGLGNDDGSVSDNGGLDAQGVIQISFTANADRFDSPTPLLNALSELTGFQSATVDAVSASDEVGYVITGVVQLGSEALGGTSRVKDLDEDLMADLHQQLQDVATGANQEPADTETDDTTIDGSTEGE